MKGINLMSCNNSGIRNLDTSIYSQSSGCSASTVKIVERTVPVYIYPPQPMPPMPTPTPTPTPTPIPPTPPVTGGVTASYAEFYNNSATGATYAAGENIAYPSTLYNTDTTDIVNNNGVFTLSGGTTGKTYLINYQVTGTNTTATLGLAVNGTVDANTQFVQAGDNATTGGSYIVNVPANTTSTVAVRVVAGTVATASPTVGTNISIVRIA